MLRVERSRFGDGRYFVTTHYRKSIVRPRLLPLAIIVAMLMWPADRARARRMMRFAGLT